MAKETIIFKMSIFPIISETFIINQVITAINLGYDVIILIGTHNKKDNNKISPLYFEYDLEKYIQFIDYKIPKNKLFRVFKWFYLLLINILLVKYIIKFHKTKSKFSLTWLYTFNFARKLNNFKVLHIQYGTNKYPFDILKEIGFFRPKLICSFHGHDAFFPINGFIENNGYYSNLFNSNSLIIANTKYLANQLIELGCNSKKIKTIPVGVNTSFFGLKSYSKDLREINIISVGRLVKVKGHSFLIEACKILKNKNYDFRLSIIGEGDQLEYLTELINKYSLQNVVFLLGPKNRNQIKRLLHENDVFIFPSISLDDGRAETQGLATIEAQSCGLPVIAFDSGGIKYTLKNNDTGFLCKEKDINSLVDKIEIFIHNKELIEVMGNKGRQYVLQTFDEKVINNIYKNVYE